MLYGAEYVIRCGWYVFVSLISTEKLLTFNTTTGTDEESYLQFDLSESCGGNNASFDADRCAYVLQRIEMTLDLGNINETFDLNFEVVETIDSNESSSSGGGNEDPCNAFGRRRRRRRLSVLTKRIHQQFRVHQHTLILRVYLAAMHGDSKGNVALAMSSREVYRSSWHK